MTDRETLRALTHAHLARPDPLGWLLAADLLEERGDDAAARVWRVRGEVYPKILAEYVRLRGHAEDVRRPRDIRSQDIAGVLTRLSPRTLTGAVRVTPELLADAEAAPPALDLPSLLDPGQNYEFSPRPGWDVHVAHNRSLSSFSYDARVRGGRVDAGWWALHHPPDARQTTQRIVRLIDAMRCAEDAPRGLEADGGAGHA